MKMEKVVVEYETMQPVGALNSPPQMYEDRSSPPLDATEAHMRHSKHNPGGAVIEVACGYNETECLFMNDCPIKSHLDDFIFDKLKEDFIPAIEIRWCGHYRPQNMWSNR